MNVTPENSPWSKGLPTDLLPPQILEARGGDLSTLTLNGKPLPGFQRLAEVWEGMIKLVRGGDSIIVDTHYIVLPGNVYRYTVVKMSPALIAVD